MGDHSRHGHDTLSLLKEVKRFLKPKNNPFRDELTLHLLDDSPSNLLVQIHPKEGPYAGGLFSIHLELPEDYPLSRPRVTALQKIFHPNISYECDFVCCSLFSLDWNNTYRLEHYLVALLFLMKNPNFDDPANHDVSEKNFQENVKLSMYGRVINGMKFPYAWATPVTSSVEEKKKWWNGVVATASDRERPTNLQASTQTSAAQTASRRAPVRLRASTTATTTATATASTSTSTSTSINTNHRQTQAPSVAASSTTTNTSRGNSAPSATSSTTALPSPVTSTGSSSSITRESEGESSRPIQRLLTFWRGLETSGNRITTSLARVRRGRVD